MSLVPYDTSRLTLYDILGVPETATLEQIRVGYLKLAKQLHPDRLPVEQRGSASATARFQAIAEAFATLSNDQRRAAYDAARLGGHRTGRDAPRSASARPPSPSAFPRRTTAASPPSWYRPSPSPAVPQHDPYASIYAQQQAHWRSAHAYHPDELDDEHVSRIGAKGSHHDMLGEVLDDQDPLLEPGRWAGFGGPGGLGSGGGQGWSVPGTWTGDDWARSGSSGWEQSPPVFGADPWGRRFEGELKPAQGGRGRRMSSNLQEGEKRRNGDYHIKNSAHSVEQTDDGTIKWSTTTLETSYSSGQPVGPIGRPSSYSRPLSGPQYPSYASSFQPRPPSASDPPFSARLPQPDTRRISPPLRQPDHISFPPSPARPRSPASRGDSSPFPPARQLGSAPTRRPSLTLQQRGMIEGAMAGMGALALGQSESGRGGTMVRRSASLRGR